MQGQRGLITRKAVVSLSYMGEDWNKGTQKQADAFICDKYVYNTVVKLLCRGSLLQPGV